MSAGGSGLWTLQLWHCMAGGYFKIYCFSDSSIVYWNAKKRFIDKLIVYQKDIFVSQCEFDPNWCCRIAVYDVKQQTTSCLQWLTPVCKLLTMEGHWRTPGNTFCWQPGRHWFVELVVRDQSEWSGEEKKRVDKTKLVKGSTFVVLWRFFKWHCASQ